MSVPQGLSRWRSSQRELLAATCALLLLAAALWASMLGARAASTPVDQCNNAVNAEAATLTCTVVINNYYAGPGAPAAAMSTLTVTQCHTEGGAGATPICVGPTTSTYGAPVTEVHQCNGSGNKGGSTVRCSVDIRNHITLVAPAATSPVTIGQCIDSIITGPGAPGTCSPVNNPTGATKLAGAETVEQCNGSGNGGTSVMFKCTVTPASTQTGVLAITVDQCNGSANGGGATTDCTTNLTNEITVVSSAATSPTPSTSPTPGTTSGPGGPTSGGTTGGGPPIGGRVPPILGPPDTGGAPIPGTSLPLLLGGAASAGMLGAGSLILPIRGRRRACLVDQG